MAVDPTVSTHTNVVSQGSSDTNPLVFGSTVGRFVIRERLGTGGMGEVYRAEDTQLKRTVAIKRLMQSATDPQASRLLKEAQRASALNHPRIAGVYDVFTTGQELLLVMEFVDGMTLRERMKHDISIADFCAIGVQCTEALTAAHEKGILHGDLKPANIMLTADGQVKVCDFGLARRLSTSPGAAETTTTTQHGLAGTPGYMAPETILEQPVDARADIFSLGVVFYQMLARRHPFAADSLMATFDRILHASPEPLDRINPGVPGRLSRTVQRMLEKEPRNRTATAAEVGDMLSIIAEQHADWQRRQHLVRRLTTAAIAAVVVLVAYLAGPPLLRQLLSPSLPPLPASMNLVVLPFATTGGANHEPFADGLTASLSGQLSRLTLNRPSLQVITEVDRRARNITTALDASQQFGSNLAIRGTLAYSSEGVQVSTALLDTKSGSALRSETFSVADANAIAVDAGVFDAATRMLNLTVDGQERERARARTRQPMAHDLYLRGRAYLLTAQARESPTVADADLAIGALDAALEVDHDYALAYATRGLALWFKQTLSGSAVLVPSARANCDAALHIDMELADAYACVATVLNGTGDYERAGVEFRRAIERDPTNDSAYAGLAQAYENARQYSAAESTFRDAIKLRPHYWRGYDAFGLFYYRLNRFEEALEQFQQAVKLAPDSYRAHNSVGGALFSLSRTRQAIDAFTRSMSIQPNYGAASNLGTLHYFEGELALAATYFEQALTFRRNRYEIWGNLAHTRERLGDKAKAREAYAEARRLVMELLRVNPRNAALYVELADHHFSLGDTARARQALADALQLAPKDGQTLFRIAVFYEDKLHMRAEALAWLKRAVEHGQTWYEIDHAPELKALRADRQFAELRTRTPQ